MQMAGSIDRLKGTVKWFDVRRGFGFITPENGGENVFVHQSSIMTVDYRSLAVGEPVEFAVSVDDDGRARAVNVMSLGGAYINDRRYFGGACYRCGEVGHMAIDCKSNGGCARLGPCYGCGEMGHLARDCPGTRFEPSSPRDNILKHSNLGSISALSSPMTMPLDVLHGDNKTLTLFEGLSQSMDSNEEEEFPSVVVERNWAELPGDVLSVIFKKIAAVEVITSAQFVCRSWQELSRKPEIWRCIDMMNQAGRFKVTELESIAMMILERSEGCVEEFHVENFGTDVFMGYMAGRATHLRCLRLIPVGNITETALVQALRRFPRLEELELELQTYFFSSKVFKRIGLACPQLKTYKFTARPFNLEDFENDSEENFDENEKALAIANHMKQLRSLHLSACILTKVGLSAILDNCSYLECLDLRGCLIIGLDENLKEKCARIRNLRLSSNHGCVLDTSSVEFEASRDDWDSASFETENDSLFLGDGNDYNSDDFEETFDEW